MLSPYRLLSLVAVLSLSTLALANSVPVSATILHSGASSVYSGGTASISAGKATPMLFTAFNNASSGSGNVHLSGLSGNAMLGKDIADHSGQRVSSIGGTHGTIARRTGDWAVWQKGSPLATPEPGSLMLLSTGLIGIAGLVRRKMRG